MSEFFSDYKINGIVYKVNLFDSYHLALLKAFGFYVVHNSKCTQIKYDNILTITPIAGSKELAVKLKNGSLLLYVENIFIPGRQIEFFGEINGKQATLENAYINVRCTEVKSYDEKGQQVVFV